MTTTVGDPQVDVEAMHRPVAPRRGPRGREAPEPTEGTERTPWWVWVLAVSSLFIGGFYLGRHGGGFSTDVHTGFVHPGASAPQRPELKHVATGAELYASRCAACHQPDGRGLGAAYPPLIGSEWVTGDPEIPVRIVLLGLAGELQVAGQAFRGEMPSWRAQLDDEEVARVVTHIRELAGASPVDAELVAKIREQTASAPSPMPAAELSKLTPQQTSMKGAP